MSDEVSLLALRAVRWIPMLLSLSVHEWAHAWAAWRLGDDTAERQGRLTLDPLAHVDPVGTLLLPMLGVPFGWAKPVPINPLRFRRGVSLRTGVWLTAAAGPISNVLLALGCTLALGLLLGLAPELVERESAARFLLESLIFLNWALAVFNAMPVPPLDGGRILDSFLPDRLRPAWDRFASLGPGALLLLLFAPRLLGFGLFDWIDPMVRGQLELLARLASG